MIDIHCHILPGLDDGARDIAETAQMLAAAKKAGVKTIIATPHMRNEVLDPQRVQEAFMAAKEEAFRLGIELYLGYEFHYRQFLDNSIEKAKEYCLADSDVLLLEFSNELPLQWENTVRELQRMGVEVIIAHPERYASIQKDIGIAERMVQLGCELQLDAESLDVGAVHAAKKCAKELLDKGLANWIASDAHRVDDYESLAPVRAKYAKQLSPPALLAELSPVTGNRGHEDHGSYTGNEGSAKKFRLPRAALIAIICLAVVGIIFSGFTIWKEYDRRARERAAYESLQSLVVEITPSPSPTAGSTESDSVSTPSPEVAPVFSGWYADYAQVPDREIDFEELHEINENIYAWISVEGVDIDFPIVHTEASDPTYLDHDIYGNKNAAGAIYTDGWNAGDFSDPNTLIYGHNMRDGSMFSPLHNFRDAKFFESNRTIKIYLAEGVMLEYEVIAAYTTGNHHILAINDFHDPEFYASYLESIYEARDITANFREASLDTDDRLITLITCVGIDDKRLFIQAVLKNA